MADTFFQPTLNMRILSVIPSGFCFGLQHITVDFFGAFPLETKSHFLLTRWGNGDMEKLLTVHGIAYSYSWLGMFSRKLDARNLKMSLHALVKLPVLYWDFWKLQRTFKPDVLYFANHHELILLYPALLFSRKPIVCHMHDPAPNIGFQRWTFRWYSKRVKKFIAISDNVRNRTIELGCAPEKITTIHNGIAIPSVERLQHTTNWRSANNWPEDAVIVGITGQMTPTKGSMDLLEAFYIVYQQNKKVRLVIGGKKAEPQYSALQEKIKSLGLEELVYFPGWIDRVDDFFAEIDVFVLASRHDEGYGLVVAEAMVRELPVVITASGGAVEIVDEGINGFIVPKSNPTTMAEKLGVMAADATLRQQMGKAGRNKIIAAFDLKKQALILNEQLRSLSN